VTVFLVFMLRVQLEVSHACVLYKIMRKRAIHTSSKQTAANVHVRHLVIWGFLLDRRNDEVHGCIYLRIPTEERSVFTAPTSSRGVSRDV